MRRVSSRFRSRLAGVNRWVTLVEWSNDGGRSWRPARLAGGSVTASQTSQTRYECSLTLVAAEVGRDGINPFTTRLRVRHGIAYSNHPDDVELVGLGVYRVEEVSRSLTGQTVEVRGSSFEAYIIDARFVTPRTLPAQSASTMIDELIREVMPDASIAWRGITPTDRVPKIIAERDRWELVDGSRDSTSVARALGARVFCDGDGVFVVAPVPALTDPAVWTATTGEGGLLVDSTEELSSDGVYNSVVVWGESTDGETPPAGPGIAVDDDPLSLSYIGGPFGQRPRFYSSQLITTKEQADRAARGMLAPYLGLRQRVSFSALHDPTLEPGDVGTVDTPSGPQKMIIDSITYDLGGGPMSCETRATATRLAGSIVDAPEEEGSE